MAWNIFGLFGYGYFSRLHPNIANAHSLKLCVASTYVETQLTVSFPCSAPPKFPTASSARSASCPLQTKIFSSLMSLCIIFTLSPATMNRRSCAVRWSRWFFRYNDIYEGRRFPFRINLLVICKHHRLETARTSSLEQQKYYTNTQTLNPTVWRMLSLKDRHIAISNLPVNNRITYPPLHI